MFTFLASLLFILGAALLGLALTTKLLKVNLLGIPAAVTSVIGVALIGFGAVASSAVTVPPGHVGVKTYFGETDLVSALPEGLSFINPLIHVTPVDVRLAKAELKNASAGTKDQQQAHTDIVVNFRLNPAQMPHIFKEFGLNVDEKVLGPAINEAFKSIIGHYSSEELITKRDEVRDRILDQLRTKVAPYDITVNTISLVNFGFSKAYMDSIEAKVIATQRKLTADQDLERIKVEAQQRITQAEGEAKAIATQAAAIQHQGGAEYVQLQAIAKWDGKLPETMAGGAVPFVNLGKKAEK